MFKDDAYAEFRDLVAFLSADVYTTGTIVMGLERAKSGLLF